jgi:hypothetical protein
VQGPIVRAGVYLLTEVGTGEQYVGLAPGANGFWGHWALGSASYVATGHGGNKKMLDLGDGNYQVSVLEVAGSSTTPEDLAKMESRWKRKLGTRTWGLKQQPATWRMHGVLRCCMPPGRCAARCLCATLGGASVVCSLPWMRGSAVLERERRHQHREAGWSGSRLLAPAHASYTKGVW